MNKWLYFLLLLTIQAPLTVKGQQSSLNYARLQNKLATGWNTWSYGSMLSHVLLPTGLTMKVNLRQSYIGTPYDPDYFYEDITVDKSGRVKPIAHSFDGSYTEVIIDNWYGNSIRVQSAANSNDIVILISPLSNSPNVHYFIELQTGFMWNKPGNILHTGDVILASMGEEKNEIRSTRKPTPTSHPYTSPYISVYGDSVVAFYTGKKMTLATAQETIAKAKSRYDNYAQKYGALSEAFKGIESVLGWNTLYDADLNRVVTPVTRGWNEAWQGFVLFEWDTYFASLLFGLDNKELAYSNAIAVTKVLNSKGAVGFTQMPRKNVSEQSQPPVGSMVCWLLYQKYRDKWFLEEVYNELLQWNRWWISQRLNNGYLTWGAPWLNAEPKHIILESGLDNSPMYEGIEVQNVGENSLMNLGDVGLNSLYASDCKFLAKIAAVLGKDADENELLKRAKEFGDVVNSMWNEKTGIYQNKFVDTKQFSERLSPTSFYPLLAGVASQKRADRMLFEHYYNRQEFYGNYIIPSCPRNDKSYNNDYWRGAVWGPMNFLVYLGLRDYNKTAATDLAQKSYDMYIQSWIDHHYIFENINSQKGAVSKDDNQINCDPYYHWGALLGVMKFMEEGKY